MSYIGENKMEIGIFFFPTDYTIKLTELAIQIEQRGFESLLLCEHTHIPASRKTEWPGGGELPEEYYHMYDPFVALSFAASVTSTLKIGTGICLVPQRDPFNLAKAVASIDQLSGGRFIFGIGGGWNVDEMENHGISYNTRFKVLREHILSAKEMCRTIAYRRPSPKPLAPPGVRIRRMSQLLAPLPPLP